jgi:cell wall-associated NlpC family hydrolase
MIAADRARALASAAAAKAEYQQAQQAAALQTQDTTVGATASTPDGTVAPPSQYGGVVGIAMRYLGVPYVWGGASPSGFDCSGFVMYVYAQVGVSLPHYTGAQWNVGVPVARGDLQPGDLVFFDGLGHVGIYIGGNQFIHAPHTGTVVQISSMTGWYASTYVGARRILG